MMSSEDSLLSARRCFCLALLACICTSGLMGCGASDVVAPAQMIPEVTVSVPASRELVDYEYFTGRIEP